MILSLIQNNKYLHTIQLVSESNTIQLFYGPILVFIWSPPWPILGPHQPNCSNSQSASLYWLPQLISRNTVALSTDSLNHSFLIIRISHFSLRDTDLNMCRKLASTGLFQPF